MKKALVIVMALMAAPSVFASRDALIDHTDKWNLFSKFELGLTEIDEGSAMLGGLSVGGLLNDRFGIGVAAHTLLDSVDTQDSFLKSLSNTDFWFGGLYTEYVFGGENLVYASVDLLIGGGRLEADRVSDGYYANNVVVVEPGINLIVNITETFMCGLGLSYRFIENVDVPGLDNSAMSGVTGSIFFRFTQF